ncbi:MAG: hypothetical protein O7I42_20570 [Alphaproteobacteria bacterium]|nr:hypothetical protein [Alphaproteobacteria bacterium]
MNEPTALLTSLHSLAVEKGASPAVDLVRDTEVDLGLVDQEDGAFVLAPRVCVRQEGTEFAELKLGVEHDLQVEILEGQASVERDPFSQELLVNPKGSTPVVARLVLRTNRGTEPLTFFGGRTELGMDSTFLSPNESIFDKAGGGACRERWHMTADEPFDFELRVRAFMPANVIALTPTKRQIRWRHALYFAHDPTMGNMRIHYNPDHQSLTELNSKGENPDGFFPASGRNDLFFVIEMLDLGYKCFNKIPMVQSYDYTDWPPYSTTLSIDEPVDFYNWENPDELMATISKNDMQLYDYDAIRVECTEWSIDDNDVLSAEWVLTNCVKETIMSRWFLLGAGERHSVDMEQGSRLLGPSGSGLEEVRIKTATRVKKCMRRQFLSMNVVSVNEPVAMGSKSVKFNYPSLESR